MRALLVIVAAALAAAEPLAAEGANQERPVWEFRAGSWLGAQEDRGGALDAGIAAALYKSGFHACALGAQNRLGVGIGWRRLGVDECLDTRSGKIRPGIHFLAITF
jgi:hypothetical protein